MRAFLRVIIAAICFAAVPAFAQDGHGAAGFWKSVQARCDATAARPASERGKHIARNAIEEFDRFGGHRIDAKGRMFHFGLTDAEQAQEYGGEHKTPLGDLAWWRVMKYWRAVYGNDIGDKLEVRGYRDASAATGDDQTATLLRADLADLLRAADTASDPATRELLREAVLRAAIIDTPWSAAFISYVVREAGVEPNAFHFANAHRVFIYDAFATSAVEATGKPSDQLYRACPLSATRPRVGDLVCFQREAALAGASEQEVRERIRADVADNAEARSVRKTHCDVVAFIDAPARKMYVIGGNVDHSVGVRKLNLHGHSLKFAAVQKANCGGPGDWTLPTPSGEPAPPLATCSLADKKWFVLLQLR